MRAPACHSCATRSPFHGARAAVRIDTVVNLEAFVRYSNMLGYLSGARRRVGFHRFNQEGLYAGGLQTHKVLYNAHIHAAHTFLDLVHALEAPPGQVPHVKRPKAMDRLEVPKITTDAATAARIWQKLRAITPASAPATSSSSSIPTRATSFPCAGCRSNRSPSSLASCWRIPMSSS